LPSLSRAETLIGTVAGAAKSALFGGFVIATVGGALAEATVTAPVIPNAAWKTQW
jgi:hypothetical protein